MPNDHSRCAPSAAHRWGNCPGSVQLSEQYPTLIEDPSGPEGTAAHEVWHRQALGQVVRLGDICENGVAVTDEMLDGAAIYLESLLAVGPEHWDRWRHETTLLMAPLGDGEIATPDSMLWLPARRAVYCTDYKFGHGRVEVFENWQLALYVLGECERLRSSGAVAADDDMRDVTVVMTVVQPRSYTGNGPVSSWTTTVGYLADRIWPKLIGAAIESRGPNAPCKVGEWCKHCPGRRACPTLQLNAGLIADTTDSRAALGLPLEAAALELMYLERAAALLSARITGLREQVEHGLRSGQRAPGWALQAGRGKKVWSSNEADVLALGDVLGVDLAKPRALITPKQAEAAFKKARLDESVIGQYSKDVPGAMALQPINTTDTKKVFS